MSQAPSQPRPSRSLFKSTLLVSGLTLVSRVLGFIRDMIVAWMLGAGPATDAFLVAFKIPNFLRRLFAEGAFSQAFVPVLSEYRSQRSPQEVKRLVDNVAGVLATVLLAVTLLAVLAAPGLVYVFAPGFYDQADKFALTAEMLRITFPYLFFIAMTALASGVLHSVGHFAAPAAAPILLNLCLITAALGFATHLDQPVVALAWGVLVAGVLQLLLQLWPLQQHGLVPRPRWGWRDPGVRRVLALMGPAMFGVSVAQINLLLDTVIASFLQSGSVSWLYYSDRLLEFPLGVFGIALATVVLPHLSQQHAERSPQQFSATLDWGLRWLLLIGVPASLGLFVLSGPLLAALFQYGAFAAADVQAARLSLMAYALGLVAMMAVKVLAAGFFSRQDTRTPVRIAVIAMSANMLLNLILVWFLAHAGLALATTLSALLNAGLLLWTLWRQGVFVPGEGWWRFGWQLVLANGVMLGWLLYQVPALEVWLQADALARAGLLLWAIGPAMALYGGSLLLSGVKFRLLRSPG